MSDVRIFAADVSSGAAARAPRRASYNTARHPAAVAINEGGVHQTLPFLSLLYDSSFRLGAILPLQPFYPALIGLVKLLKEWSV
jgi:hypothetical protein